MNAAATHRLTDNPIPDGYGTSFFVSIFFHAVIIVIAIFGLPYIAKPVETLSTPIPIEILPIGEVTTTNKPPVQAPKPKEPPPEEKPPERKEIKKPPAPPKVEAKEPPKAIPPEPPKEKPKPAEKPKSMVPPPDAEVLEKPKSAMPAPAKEETVDNQQAFDSLLRNLQDSEAPVDETLPVAEDVVEPPLPSPIGDFSKQLLVSEADALRQQLSQCWSIQAGAKYAENLVVEIRLTVNRDRTVQNAVIQDRWRYNQDPAFRAAADSAVRAVLSPMCTPLRLPPEKYEGWKDIIVSFDPKDML